MVTVPRHSGSAQDAQRLQDQSAVSVRDNAIGKANDPGTPNWKTARRCADVFMLLADAWSRNRLCCLARYYRYLGYSAGRTTTIARSMRFREHLRHPSQAAKPHAQL